jgi:hypothetical protein
MSTRQDMRVRLRDQLEFLKGSAEAFDAGKTAEAVRIATALRVIFHQTKASTSLLNHLNAPGIMIRSKAHQDPPGATPLFGWSLASIR